MDPWFYSWYRGRVETLDALRVYTNSTMSQILGQGLSQQLFGVASLSPTDREAKRVAIRASVPRVRIRGGGGGGGVSGDWGRGECRDGRRRKEAGKEAERTKKSMLMSKGLFR